MADRQERKDSIDRRAIDIDRKKASPVILASLLGVTEPMLDKYRQKDLLPQNTDASLAESITFFCNQLRQITSGKTSDLVEQATLADTRLKLSRMEGEYLDQKIKRKLFVEVSEMEELFTPVLGHIMEQLHTIARDFPNVKPAVIAMTKSLNKLGQDMEGYARKDEEEFVKIKMEQDVEGSEELKEIKKLFGFYEE
jgi:phage terminase Nu1 subunit (DNA packaging protein)